MQRLSYKSRDALYKAVADEILQARLKIKGLDFKDENLKEQIDQILYRLHCKAPVEALNCFIYEEKP